MLSTTSTIPARFRDKTLEDYDGTISPSTAKALAAARRMEAGEIKSLVLIGAAGVGKTHLAAGVMRRLGGEWQNVAELIVGMRADMDRVADDRQYQWRPNELRRERRLVVLDDLGREKISDWTGETIYSLVNARYEAMLPTLVTSNLTPEQLVANGYWPAISRLAEDGVLVRVEAPDRRLAR